MAISVIVAADRRSAQVFASVPTGETADRVVVGLWYGGALDGRAPGYRRRVVTRPVTQADNGMVGVAYGSLRALNTVPVELLELAPRFSARRFAVHLTEAAAQLEAGTLAERPQ